MRETMIIIIRLLTIPVLIGLATMVCAKMAECILQIWDNCLKICLTVAEKQRRLAEYRKGSK